MEGSDLILDVEEDQLDQQASPPGVDAVGAMAFGGSSSFVRKKSVSISVSPRLLPEPEPEPKDPQLESNTLRLELREVEVQKLHKLDVANQSFQTTVWMEFIIPGGGLSQSLSEGMSDRPPTQHFPVDPDTGKPTFLPSATWYMAQLDCRNALNWRLVDGKIMRRGDDLVMAVRVEGSFVEIFELGDYPFDSQGLTCTLNFK
jgi:hypothetical protein